MAAGPLGKDLLARTDGEIPGRRMPMKKNAAGTLARRRRKALVRRRRKALNTALVPPMKAGSPWKRRYPLNWKARLLIAIFEARQALQGNATAMRKGKGRTRRP